MQKSVNIHRSPIRILGEILGFVEQSGEQGIKTTKLLTKANLSYSGLSRFIENLTSAGLITTREIDSKNAFVITSKGKEYLASYREFIELTESYGLKL